MGASPYRGPVDRCVACGAELGVGRFCLNCGHPVGTPAPEVVEHPPIAPPVQAADPTPVAPTNPPDLSDDAPAAEPEPEPEAEPEPEPAPEPEARPEWDPRQDLLPYESVDDVDEAPIDGRAWIFWVVGALLLVGLVVVLLQVFGAEDDVSATDPAGQASSQGAPGAAESPADAEEAATDTPTGVGTPVQLVEGATFAVEGTAPPTTDFDGNLVAYEASQMGDGDPTTAWRTDGAAEGQEIRVTLPQEAVVSRVGMVNGYAKQVAGVDWYPNNRRILSVTWTFDDGSSVEQTFAERPAMQRLEVTPVQTSTVVITINAVTPPGAGDLGRDYTAVSEVAITGRLAG